MGQGKMMKDKQATGARSWLRLGVAAAAAGLWLATLGAAEAQYTRYTPAAPEPGTDVPQATVNFGMRPFADNTFGCVVNGFVLRNVADLKATLAELYRVLEPGGHLACLELTHAPPAIETLFGFYFNRIVPRLGALVSGQGDAYRYLSRSLDGFPDADGLAALMVQAGFTNVSYVRLGLGAVAIHLGQKAAM